MLRVCRAGAIARRCVATTLPSAASASSNLICNYSSSSDDEKPIFPTSHTVNNDAYLDSLPEELEARARQRNEEIRTQHFAAPASSSIPANSHGETTIDADLARRKRVIYRSKQRGWLEVDLLLGSWASKNVMDLSEEDLSQYEDILNQETIDIFNYISGKQEIPEELNTPMMQRLQEYSRSSPIGQASVDAFEKNKKYMSN